MEEPPLVAEWGDRLTETEHVVVVPFFIADGLHSFEDIPVLARDPRRRRREKGEDLFSAGLAGGSAGGRLLYLRELDRDRDRLCRSDP